MSCDYRQNSTFEAMQRSGWLRSEDKAMCEHCTTEYRCDIGTHRGWAVGEGGREILQMLWNVSGVTVEETRKGAVVKYFR